VKIIAKARKSISLVNVAGALGTLVLLDQSPDGYSFSKHVMRGDLAGAGGVLKKSMSSPMHVIKALAPVVITGFATKLVPADIKGQTGINIGRNRIRVI